jgi:Na+/melibiose symporter-like transporter
MKNMPSSQKLSVTEKIGYSLGDLAANLIFQTLVTFLAFFYTNVFGIPADKASYVIGSAGLIGALIFTPLMGFIADRTATRWGKFRPWLLWTAVPFGVFALLAFSTPNIGQREKVIYAFVTYLLLLAVYAANNLPYSALSGVLTGNMADRNSLSAYRFVAVMFAQFIIQVLLLPLVLILGHGDKAVGFHNAMFFFSITGVVFFLIAFITTKERILPIAKEKTTVLQDIRDLVKNVPWIIMLLVTVLVFVTLALKGGFYIYFFQDYLSEPALARFLETIGFNHFIGGLNSALHAIGLTEFKWPDDAPTSAFGLFNGCGIIMMIIGIGFSKPLADRFGKRNTFATALFISTIFVFSFDYFPKDAIALCFISQTLHGFFYGITIPLLWAMIADVADYSEWRNNRRATAIVFSAMLLGLKAGLTIGGSLVAGILAHYHYDAALPAQAPDTVRGIQMGVSVYASIPFLAAIALLWFYCINKPMETQIESDLKQRREAVAN